MFVAGVVVVFSREPVGTFLPNANYFIDDTFFNVLVVCLTEDFKGYLEA